ncbi:LmbE family N-acetylglucosaminyl deacetylase [Kribbella sp. VKM Ac-2527]|uniref:LmbE family N-acetylglucosaminyl deacetylase n=1 Tax=Kribbella caucasensis TaxID=2512215 RepID=A0A4R6KQ61_9ACTN|nr:PIG-L family deacetylase [Kribbella sp. VKM Ac-2527]TDO51759.1 LmbE family N-acetylglucosaminyl deacetylase [Kribbella sp. VKM Ac-2527]
MPFTLVSFHAHPDDEALLTGGTLARLAAEGHRVVLAVATDGEAGAAASSYRTDLAARRRDELDRSAAALGCARVVRFGLPDSGWTSAEQPPAGSFSRLPVTEAAAPLADLLREERADALTIYDPAGGYGHPDHRQVHAAGLYAARLAGTPLVPEATIDRTLIRRLIRLVSALPGVLPDLRAADYEHAYTSRSDITHRLDVRQYSDAKRRSFEAHVSQASSDDGARTLALLLRLPPWLFRRVLGREWFVEHGRRPGVPPVDDLFASLRTPHRAHSADSQLGAAHWTTCGC